MRRPMLFETLLQMLLAVVCLGTMAGVVRCSSVRDGKYYHSQLETDEYGQYLAGEGLGRWYGEGAQRFGMRSGAPVESEDFKRLLNGLGPNGEKLTQNVGRKNRTAGIELNFSTAKSFSALYALANKTTGRA